MPTQRVQRSNALINPNQLRSCFTRMAIAGPAHKDSPIKMITGVFKSKKLSSFLRLRRQVMVAPLFVSSKCLYRQKNEPECLSCYGYEQSIRIARQPRRRLAEFRLLVLFFRRCNWLSVCVGLTRPRSNRVVMMIIATTVVVAASFILAGVDMGIFVFSSVLLVPRLSRGNYSLCLIIC